MPGAMRGIVSAIVLLALLCSKDVASAERLDEGEGFERELLIPCANPLQESDAGLFAWHTATELLTLGVDELAESFSLGPSRTGRFGHLLLTVYVNYATSYYGHEVAHQFPNKRKNQHFWIDMGDWSRLVPRFVFNQWHDRWNMEDLYKYSYFTEDNPHIVRWLILVIESGLY